jgi:hypothetical protein
VSYAISAMLAEVGVLSTSTITWPGEIGESGIVERQLEEGEDGGGAEGARRLFAAVDAVAVIEFGRRWGWGSELDGAALAGNVHDKRYKVLQQARVAETWNTQRHRKLNEMECDDGWS